MRRSILLGQLALALSVIGNGGPLKAQGTGNDALFVSQTVPTSLRPGEAFNVELTFLNRGTTTWSLSNRHFLGSHDPRDNFTWSTNRFWMDPSDSVPPWHTYSFSQTLTAPSVEGTYTFRWRLLQDAVEWFGAPSLSVTIQVTSNSPPPTPATSTNRSRFVSQQVPTTLRPGETFDARITFENTGASTWSLANTVFLGSDGCGRVGPESGHLGSATSDRLHLEDERDPRSVC